MALISVRGLAVSRGGRRAVEGVDFDLAAGEALILRGPNGIGKTTLLRTVAGLQPATEGSIQADPDSIAYAAHADGLKGALSVAENLRFWREVFGGPAIDRAVAAMNLSDLVSRPAAMLSAGQKRRLGLARLLVTGRPVWVLDEPTVSLDAGSVALFADAAVSASSRSSKRRAASWAWAIHPSAERRRSAVRAVSRPTPARSARRRVSASTAALRACSARMHRTSSTRRSAGPPPVVQRPALASARVRPVEGGRLVDTW